MTNPGDPTQPLRAFRTATRPLEELPAAGHGPWHCARCHGPSEPFSQGHYQDACLATGEDGTWHFCCPQDCQLKGAGAMPGTRP